MVKRRLAEYIDEDKAFGIRQNLLKAGITPYLITLTYNDGFKQNQSMKRRPDGTNSIPLQGTCAVVGSAGILQNSRCGCDIDGHDFVFRGNLAKTIDFEEDVGTKTDLMVLNGASSVQSSKCLTNLSASCHEAIYKTFDELNDTYIWISKLDVSKNISYAHDLVAGIKKNNLRVKIVYPYRNLLSPITRFWKIKNPSLGLIMYTAAASICRRVSLYGFYPFYKLPNGEPLKHHYYDNRTLNYTTNHHMPAEYEMLKSFNKSRIIRLVTDKCRNL
ncbi:alpha-2,8-sialyltransferase 8B-like [Anneissia japonica]|uniref:alpha-2,8-sialyltransferase 8B-like n=1 Tax=Anneissia japonica TaxID=1529436 RepID=UPI001425AEDA|nr:alpha-2,8-sialyltransferase 8B-like [Anneissia japonica]